MQIYAKDAKETKRLSCARGMNDVNHPLVNLEPPRYIARSRKIMKRQTKSGFPDVPVIQYEGPRSKNPLAFKWYHPDEIVEGKAMKDHLRFSVVYWHTMRGMGADMFGVGTMQRPWEDGTDSIEMAKRRVPVFFELLEKLGAPFYAFHDRDIAPHGKTLLESNRYLDTVVKLCKEEQKRVGV